MQHERVLAASPFPGDDGLASPAVRRALGEAVRDPSPSGYLRAVAALCETRLLVPLVATATRQGTTAGGLLTDKEAEMSVVLLQAPDGRRALLGFTGLDALQTWQSDARPVPVTLDLARGPRRARVWPRYWSTWRGPHPLAIDGDVLTSLAAGHRLVETGPAEFGWAIPVATAGPGP